MKLLSLLVLVGFMVGLAEAKAPKKGTLEDDVPFPLFCVSFAGTWTAEDGDRYRISQKKCSWLQIDSLAGSSSTSGASTIIVPDNKTRIIDGDSLKGQARYRWNALEYGAVLESYSVVQYKDRKETDVGTLEVVDTLLMVEETHKLIEFTDGQSPQQIHRKRYLRKTFGGDANPNGGGPTL